MMALRGITGTDPTTFLNYHGQNLNEARLIASIYEKYEGIKFFFAERDIPKGAPWFSVIENAIYSTTGFLALWGPFGLSDYQNIEIEIAKRRLKETDYKIFSILLPGCRDIEEMPDILRQYQLTDYRKAIFDLEEHYRLVEAIKKHNISRSSKYLASVFKRFGY